MNSEKYAGLDLGTNTFLCLICETLDGKIQVLEDAVETVRLGQDIDKTQQLHVEALQRADACLGRFRKLLDHHGVNKISVAATSAARDAKNGDALFALGRKHGLQIQIIEGHREAEVSFRGACFGLPTDHEFLVIDVGGGSTELILGSSGPRGRLIFKTSLNLGGVRLRERMISKYPVSAKELQALKEYIHDEISKASIPNISEDCTVLAVAGTPTSLAALALGGFIENKVNGYELTLTELKTWIHVFSSMSVEEIQGKYQLGGRSDIILVGTLILAAALEKVNRTSLRVSTKGVRYGLVMEQIAKY